MKALCINGNVSKLAKSPTTSNQVFGHLLLYPKRSFDSDVLQTEFKIVTHSHLMALTWAAPRIARQARSPPAIPMTTRTTSNTPSTPSTARTTRWDHFTLLPSLTAPPSPRSHTDWRQRPRDSKAPHRAAAPKRRKSVPTPVPASQSHLGPSARRFFFCKCVPEIWGKEQWLVWMILSKSLP